ncbi:MAG: hypothetical protein GY778_05640 [bacterium]|nr:hypothetical protein [bacterium]
MVVGVAVVAATVRLFHGPVSVAAAIARPGKYGSFYKKMRPLFESAESKSREFNDFGYMKYEP